MTKLDGMTAIACPTACNEERCIISGRGHCTHPCKGGIPEDIQTPEILERFAEARKLLGLTNKGVIAA